MDSILRLNNVYTHWIILSEVLFHCREYEKSIFYTNKAIKEYVDKGDMNIMARFNNTIAQDFDRLGKWDSALLYYEKSMKLSESEVWKGINAGYIGELYFNKKEYATAKPFLEYSYVANRTKEYDHAAKSLQVLAAIDLAQNNNDSALIKIREALALIKKAGSGFYLQPLSFLERIYYTATDVFRAVGNTDSFYVYNRLYLNLHDSLQRISLLTSTKMAQLRIDNDNNLRGIQLLEREKQNATIKRNFIILSVLLGSVILLLYFNRLRLKQKHRQEFALQQKNAAETELKAAKEQMQLFTENIVEKTELIEKLSQQISHKEQNSEQQQLINEISHQTILTEEDWENFKSLFEKVYPGFFLNLKEKARDITIAEQRMAALTRLNLTARQMATMLGISVDSVHKSRQRLRQRLQFSSETNLEETLSSL
jgi:DNA-binding CsgD family transcriptional regulator